jgi:hypothetical protein
MTVDLAHDFTSGTIESIVVIEHIVSMACSSLIIFSYLRFEELRTPGFTLVLLLTVCDAAANLSYIAFPPPDTGSAACYAQAILVSFFVAASVLWSMTISLTIYATVLGALGRPPRKLRACLDRPLMVHAGVWGTSLVLSLLPLSTHSTGHNAGPLCWVAVLTSWGQFWVFFTAYGPIWATIGITVFISCRIRFEILSVVSLMAELEFNNRSTSTASPAATEAHGGYSRLLMFYNSLKWYPVILIVAWTPSTAVRISQTAGYTLSPTAANVFTLVTGMFIQGQRAATGHLLITQPFFARLTFTDLMRK